MNDSLILDTESPPDLLLLATMSWNASDIGENTTEEIQSMMENSAMTYTYCSESWRQFWIPFRQNYPPVKLTMCLVGVVTNILNLVVFTRPKMRNPTNLLLISLAVADLLCCLREVQYVGWSYTNVFPWGSYQGTVNELVNDILINLFHTWSVYLTLVVAMWRLLGVLRPLKSRQWCTWRGARWAILTAILAGCILMIPMYYTVYFQGMGDTDWSFGLNWDIYIWIVAILIKLVPCVILTVVISTLVIFLLQVQKDRVNLRKSGTVVHKNPNGQQSMNTSQFSKKETKETSEFNRTTKMLLAVLIVFLLTEFPAGLGLLLNAILGYTFYLECRQPAIAIMNFLDYSSSVTSFFVYFIMSKNFRENFFNICRSRPGKRGSKGTTLESTLNTSRSTEMSST